MRASFIAIVTVLNLSAILSCEQDPKKRGVNKPSRESGGIPGYLERKEVAVEANQGTTIEISTSKVVIENGSIDKDYKVRLSTRENLPDLESLVIDSAAGDIIEIEIIDDAKGTIFSSADLLKPYKMQQTLPSRDTELLLGAMVVADPGKPAEKSYFIPNESLKVDEGLSLNLLSSVAEIESSLTHAVVWAGYYRDDQDFSQTILIESTEDLSSEGGDIITEPVVSESTPPQQEAGGFALDGVLDTSFSGGQVSLQTDYDVFGVVQPTQDRIWILSGLNSSGSGFVSQRLLDGSIDTEFSALTHGNQFQVPGAPASVKFVQAKVLSNGNIAIAGTANPTTLTSRPFLVVLGPDGEFASSFNNGTYLSESCYLSESAAFLYGIAEQSDGSLILAMGLSGNPNSICVEKVGPDGIGDTSFGAGGTFEATLESDPESDYFLAHTGDTFHVGVLSDAFYYYSAFDGSGTNLHVGNAGFLAKSSFGFFALGGIVPTRDGDVVTFGATGSNYRIKVADSEDGSVQSSYDGPLDGSEALCIIPLANGEGILVEYKTSDDLDLHRLDSSFAKTTSTPTATLDLNGVAGSTKCLTSSQHLYIFSNDGVGAAILRRVK